MIEARASDDPICRAPWDRPDGTVLMEPFDKLRIPAHRSDMQPFTVEPPHVTVSGLAEPGCTLENRIEDPWSPGELEMTLSTSSVAACCSRDSFSSRVRR